MSDLRNRIDRNPHASTALWAAGIACGVGAPALTLPLRGLWPVVLGPVIIADPWAVVFVGLDAAGVALLVAARRLRLRQEAAGVRAPRGRGRTVAVTLASTAAVAAGVALGSSALLFGLASDAHLLEPASPAGARVLVVQRSFLLMGTACTYVVPAGGVVAVPLGSQTTDDGLDPVAHGAYRLTWTGEHPDLYLDGMG